MTTESMQALAYCIFNAGEWRNFCPPCWDDIFQGEVEADAEMTFLNGDVMYCRHCLTEIR